MKITFIQKYLVLHVGTCKDTWVADHMQLRNIFSTRPVHDWGVDLVSSFFEFYSLKVRQGVRIEYVGSLPIEKV